MKNEGKTALIKVAMASAVLLMLAVCIAPVSAEDTFASNNHTYITVANDDGVRYNAVGNDTYYCNFAKVGGGLKSMHLTDSTSDTDGDTYSAQSASGTFYVSDTSKDPGCHDDVILMFAVPSSADYSNLSLQVDAAGYQWTPTADGSKPVLDADLDYVDSTLSEAFAGSDFLSGTSEWRLASQTDYPVYYDQDMSQDEQFKIMFIDLYSGSLNQADLNDGGMVKVTYEITGYSGAAYFDVYAWNNQAKQGQGISWTNRITGTGSSGWGITAL